MGFLKFVIPFVGGALTAAAVGAAMQKKKDEEEKAEIEVDAEFVEKADDEENNTVW